MVKFATQYNKDNSKHFSPSGTGLIPVYYVRLDKHGNRVVDVKKDSEGNIIYDDVYSKIQAQADSTNINSIISKFVQTGNPDVLIQNRGAFLDLTTMPSSQFEMMNKLISARETFSRLPQEVRNKFGNDVNKFIAMAGQPQFFEMLGYKDINKDGIVDKSDVDVKKDTKEGESNE